MLWNSSIHFIWFILSTHNAYKMFPVFIFIFFLPVMRCFFTHFNLWQIPYCVLYCKIRVFPVWPIFLFWICKLYPVCKFCINCYKKQPFPKLWYSIITCFKKDCVLLPWYKIIWRWYIFILKCITYIIKWCTPFAIFSFWKHTFNIFK